MATRFSRLVRRRRRFSVASTNSEYNEIFSRSAIDSAAARAVAAERRRRSVGQMPSKEAVAAVNVAMQSGYFNRSAPALLPATTTTKAAVDFTKTEVTYPAASSSTASPGVDSTAATTTALESAVTTAVSVPGDSADRASRAKTPLNCEISPSTAYSIASDPGNIATSSSAIAASADKINHYSANDGTTFSDVPSSLP